MILWSLLWTGCSICLVPLLINEFFKISDTFSFYSWMRIMINSNFKMYLLTTMNYWCPSKVSKPRSLRKSVSIQRKELREHRGPSGCQGGPAGVPPELKGRVQRWGWGGWWPGRRRKKRLQDSSENKLPGIIVFPTVCPNPVFISGLSQWVVSVVSMAQPWIVRAMWQQLFTLSLCAWPPWPICFPCGRAQKPKDLVLQDVQHFIRPVIN